ncbi:MAG: YraN family protein [Defluviitaleaceae bacterium]|nr:YraN family protein [Defluviitaleaceae bacterium]
MTGNSKAKGDYGENVVSNYLTAKDYKILTRNFKARGGEIDIVAQDGEYIVFIEVKYRTGISFGEGIEAVNTPKSRRIIAAAKAYLYQQDKWEYPCRFDIVEVFGRGHLDITHHENAFWEN